MANSPSGESVIERFLRILETFDRRHSTLTVSMIAERAHLPLTTAHRLTAEMVAVGVLRRRTDRRLQVGIRLWELSYRSLELQRLREAALPAMIDVQEAVRQHTNLAVRDDDHVLYLERLSSPNSTLSIAHTASRLPVGRTSSGLVLVAFGASTDRREFLAGERSDGSSGGAAAIDGVEGHLDDIRRNGYCVAPGYTVPESTGVAVPVFSPDGSLIAALGVIIPRDNASAHAVVPELVLGSRAITAALKGGAPQPERLPARRAPS